MSRDPLERVPVGRPRRARRACAPETLAAVRASPPHPVDNPSRTSQEPPVCRAGGLELFRQGRRGESESPCDRLLIIGLGNEYRRDDAVGLVVARELRRRTPGGVEVIEHSGEGAALVEAWKGYTTVFLVDAVRSTAPAGTVHRLDARSGPIPGRFFSLLDACL